MLRMNKLAKFATFTVAVAFFAASVAEAQQPQPGGRQGGGFGGQGGGFGGGGTRGGQSKIDLVGRSQVQTELKISEDQKFFVDGLLEMHSDKRRELFSGLGDIRDLSQEDRDKKINEMRTKSTALTKENEKALGEFLTAAQNTRLQEISIQTKGIRALQDEEVQKELALDTTQKKKLDDIFKAEDDARAKLFEGFGGQGGGQGGRPGQGGQPQEGGRPQRPNPTEIFFQDEKPATPATPGGQGGRAGQGGQGGAQGGRAGQGGQGGRFTEIRDKMEAMTKDTETKALAVLTADQKTKFEAMKGAKFELEQRGGGQGGQPGQGQRPGGNNGGQRPGGTNGGGRPSGDNGGRPAPPQGV